MDELDFGYASTTVNNGDAGEEKTDLSGNNKDKVDINNPENNINNNNEPPKNEPTNEPENKPETKPNGELTNEPENKLPYKVGTTFEFENNTYTIDENGNLIDSNNQIFKSKDEIEDWVKSLEIDSDDDKGEVISIADIQKAVGITITDNEDNEIEFENTPQGIADYINSVVETTRETVAQQTLETLYAQYPFLESILTYYVANGNSIKGFNELRDRSNIRLDANNEAQLEAIIRDAWRETNRKGNIDDYINYLKSSNKLYDIASEELDDMVERDKAAKESLAQKAIEVEKQREEESRQYWGKVKETIDNRVIGKYKLPETILVNRNGKKVAVTPNDFYNYLYRVDQNGHSQYENELAQETPENSLNDALLRAYLKFTGGSYESLVNMAINEEKINAIKLKSRKTTTTKVKVTTPKSKSNDIDLGYN